MAAAGEASMRLSDPRGERRRVPNPQPDARPTDRGVLKPRQIEILEAIAQGMSVQEMATKFGLTAHTVRAHIKHILRRLRAHSRAEAVALALVNGIIRFDREQ